MLKMCENIDLLIIRTIIIIFFFYLQRCHYVTMPVTNPQPFIVCPPLVMSGDLTASLGRYSLASSWTAHISIPKSHSSILPRCDFDMKRIK